MSRANSIVEDDPLDREIDFTKLQRVSNTFARDFVRSRNVRVLAPDLLDVFPDLQSVNAALRAIVDAGRGPKNISAAPKSK